MVNPMKSDASVLMVVGLVLVLSGLAGLYAYVNDLKNTGVQYEEQISALYENNQNVLSTIIVKFHETVGIAELKTAKMDSIITHAVTGRYGDQGFQPGSPMFAAVMEAYPDLTGLNIYDKIADALMAGREQFKNEQAKLRDVVRAYDTWRRSGLLREFVVGMMFPSDKLEARIGGEVVAVGEEALARMRTLINAGSALESYRTGELTPLTVSD